MKNSGASTLTIAFCLFITSLIAQEKESKIYIGLQVSPNFSYRVLSNNSGKPSVNDDIRYLNDNEEAALGYRVAAVTGYKLSKHWTVEAGVAYLENCTVLNLKIGDQDEPRGGFIPDESLEAVDLKNCLSYAGIPIRLIGSLGTDKVRVLASFGLTPQILLDQRTMARRQYTNREDETSEIDNAEDAAGFNLSPSLGLGAELKLNERFFLRAEGIARFGVVDISEDSAINSYSYSSELNLGMNYVIK